jgi:FkbM family methyltransferase
MVGATDLSDYPAIPPRDFVRKLALKGITLLLLARGYKLPPYFSIRERYEAWLRPPEPDVRNLGRRLLRTGMIVADVGANVGFLTRHFSDLVGPDGKVFSFEPDPLNFRFLEFNTGACQNVERAQVAISNNAEPALLHLNSGSGAGNSLVNQSQSAQSVAVSCVRLDEFFADRGNPQINLIKIDVEGAEMKVLQGMSETIRRLPNLQIIIEYCPKNLESAGIKPSVVYDTLNTLDFAIAAIRKDGTIRNVSAFDDLEPLLNRNGYVNLFCSRNGLD